jgi:hypothetical protein
MAQASQSSWVGDGRPGEQEMKQDIRRYELEGLCMTCNHAGSCGYLAVTEGPIWRCEEFDDSEPVSAAGAARPHPPRPPADLLSDASRGPRGLCCNCDNRSFCGFPKTQDEVLFCEEYR